MSLFNVSRLLGKTVLITGASSGIGAVSRVLSFCKAGSNVILVARRVDALKSVADACVAAHKESGVTQGGKFATIQADVADKEQVAAILDKIPSDLKAVDVLGIEHIGDIADADVEGMFATNVLGLIRLTQIFVREFKARNSGHVINLGSVAGREAYAGGGIYCATKFAVSAFNGSLLKELVNTPIRVTEIQPGMVETEFSIVRFRGDTDRAKTVYDGMQPLVASDIAEEILWVASRPPHVNIAEMLIFPVNQAGAGLVYRAPK
ncbi:NAD(P)-binding protein [Pleurotus eryngii]|uniref:NAD(P)-binding protein n=1 Tax=Pleurotus eryngii TaxID=5323 RepID=A0A9P6A697_PLEER|nr:NAD(P)-binding protein [Pleurotus eryngii]